MITSKPEEAFSFRQDPLHRKVSRVACFARDRTKSPALVFAISEIINDNDLEREDMHAKRLVGLRHIGLT